MKYKGDKKITYPKKGDIIEYKNAKFKVTALSTTTNDGNKFEQGDLVVAHPQGVFVYSGQIKCMSNTTIFFNKPCQLLQKVYTEDLRPASTSKYVNFLDYIEKADDFFKKKKEQCESTLNVIKEYMEDNKNEISI